MAISIVITFGVCFCLVLPMSLAQLLPEEVPDELQHIINGDLDTWKPPKEVTQKYPYYFSGFDIDDRPIWVLEFGKWDIPTLFRKGDEWEGILSKHVNQWLWKMYNSTGLKATPEKPVKEIVAIIDMDGYGIQQINSAKAVAFVIGKMRTITKALVFAHGAYVINANYFAQTLLSILRPILGKDFERLDIYGTNPSKYHHVLLKEIPRNQIAEWYGGEKDFKPVQVFG